MRPEPSCVINPSFPCRACLAPDPRQCPYTYLLDAEELSAVVAAHEERAERADEKVRR